MTNPTATFYREAMHSPSALAADSFRRMMHLDSAADRVIARATSDLDERTYQHQRAYGRGAAAARRAMLAAIYPTHYDETNDTATALDR